MGTTVCYDSGLTLNNVYRACASISVMVVIGLNS